MANAVRLWKRMIPRMNQAMCELLGQRVSEGGCLRERRARGPQSCARTDARGVGGCRVRLSVLSSLGSGSGVVAV